MNCKEVVGNGVAQDWGQIWMQ